MYGHTQRRANRFRRYKPGTGVNKYRKRTENAIDIRALTKKASLQNEEQVVTITHQFSDFALMPEIRDSISAKGYKIPSPIQDQVIPAVLDGRDVVGIANTGTGKTAAFLIPLIQKMLNNRFEKILIVAPTRELAVQIQDEFISFARDLRLYSVLCIGGVNIRPQIEALRRNPNVVIGTPGRLKDLHSQNRLKISQFQTIVLDEVDRMLDMGFIRDVRFLVSQLPEKRQSLFFSATLSQNIKDIIGEVADNPLMISVKRQETAANVDQDVIRTEGRQKLDILHDLLIRDSFSKVIVFGKTKWGVEKLSRQLTDRGFSVAALHGNKNQNQRQRALNMFKSNEVSILLATDIASRGIDVDDVTHVINYELPESYDDYVHRIGRTGRNNKKGIALSLVD